MERIVRDMCSLEVISEFRDHPKVLEALRSKRFIVIKCGNYQLHVFKGHDRDYLVSPCRFCSCYDFLINVLSRKRRAACYHVIGFRIAEELGRVVTINLDPEELREVLLEIIINGFSIKLRRYV